MLRICRLLTVGVAISVLGGHCFGKEASLVLISQNEGMGINQVKACYRFTIKRRDSSIVELKVADVVIEIEQKIDMSVFTPEMIEQIKQVSPDGVPEKVRLDFSDPAFRKENEGKLISVKRIESDSGNTWELIEDETAKSSDPKMFPPLALGNAIVELWTGEPDTNGPYWIPVKDVVRKKFSGSEKEPYQTNVVFIPEVNRPIFISRKLAGNGVPAMSITDKDLSMGEEAKTFISCSWLITQPKPNVSIKTFIQSIDNLIAAKDKDLLDRSRPLRQLGNSCLLGK